MIYPVDPLQNSLYKKRGGVSFSERASNMQYIKRDITTVERGIIAHGVNCQHAMGAGVALAILKKYPQIREIYMNMPKGKEMLGVAHLINVGKTGNELFVANCYTQEYFGNDGKQYASADAIFEAFGAVFAKAKAFDLPVYLPQIGAGLGGLNWELDVEPIINHYDILFPEVETTICLWG